TEYKNFGDGFRADDGFVPQVGFHENYIEAGHTVRPTNFPISRLRTYLIADYQADTDNSLIFRQISPGFGMDGVWNSFTRIRYAFDRVRAGSTTYPRQQLIYLIQVSPSRTISQITLQGTVGQQVDFDNARAGTGADINLQTTIRPTDHLSLATVAAR